MASSFSFDIVSQVDVQEVKNSINQSMKEIEQRYDFKGSKTEIEIIKDEEIKITTDDEYKLSAVIDILKGKLIKRGVSPKALDFLKIEKAALGLVRQNIKLINGLSKEKTKDIVSSIKNSKIKVQPQIIDDRIRVVGKNKDDLQQAIGFLKSNDFGVELQFNNYR
ncbi:YajQ family cyclic di-GMP-binding protein [Clostridium hydrogeniformans]|uniref:YajQ family cyclic di-GMP-binding protein n=1 Tax=Clostridium hydrogeniformans TaxID=349933 RepID=UPI0004830438|nr:YajQ family cyclic di-GMP-binding protein [Clostridium hydrogeniformans]